MLRAFLAVELSSLLRDALESVQDDIKRRLQRGPASRIAWVRPGSIHLTFFFLGEMQEAVIEPLREAVAQGISAHRPIDVPLQRLGAFPRVHAPRVLWIGPLQDWEAGEGAQRLAAMQRAVAEICEVLGFERDPKPFHPHVTLARIKEGERSVGELLASSGLLTQQLVLPPLTIESIALMKSELRPTGSLYTPLWHMPLRP